ncbi:hypothetical protein [Mariprofundus sp. KV]|uniref:hypothetical protein n=1 Tax=Mariprofundus sp. KV TaxID=2608715 RepID=UPI0015A418BB|nr:hypothetical protein [Mariprofundus sp. KV]NWF37130.1 hypothetical protein [Mariprofundus sp. KV]
MNIIATLNTFRGRELDDTLMQLLARLFDAQHNEIDQLKDKNTRLQTSLTDASENVEKLLNENAALNKMVIQLQSQLSGLQSSASKSRLSEVETAILSNCIDSGVAGFCSEDMVDSLIYSRLEVTNAIDQLERKGLIQVGPLARSGTFYRISETGKKYEKDIENNDYSF